MLFTGHFFLLYFFPIFMLLYLPLSKKIRLSNVIIIIFSLLFYASFGAQNLPVLIAPLFLNYVVGMSLPIPGNKERKILLALSILGNVGILVYYKYFNFLLNNLLFFLPKTPLIPVLQQHASFIIPVGVSFIIFQGVSYLVDVYRKKTPPEKNFIRFATYASIFPHLIAGPIVRYSQIKDELSKRKITSLDIFNGFKYFAVGLFFKVAIADQLFTVENLLIQNTAQLHFFESLTLIFFFSFRILFDFWGYSLIALGIAKMLGFNFPKNFLDPYQSISVTDFWNRWNVTLSRWLRDYIYIPLGGNRKGNLRTYFNLMITMLLAGFWHGANWNFVIWGGLHGSYLATERFLTLNNISFRIPSFIKKPFIFLLISFTWLTFIFSSPTEILNVVKSLTVFSTSFDPKVYSTLKLSLPALILAIVWAFILKEKYLDLVKSGLALSLCIIIVFLISVGLTFVNEGIPFIYFLF